MKNESIRPTLRIAFYKTKISEIDPANIESLNQANLIENLYSRIVDYDNNGQLKCSLCKKFWIENDIINFEIKNGIRTKSGYILTVKDIFLSLQRLLKLNTNTEGSLLFFIKNSSDIFIEENILKIKLKSPHYSQFVLPLLASMDYSIIPAISIDKNNKIFDFNNTSGAYYIQKIENDGALVLQANSNINTYSDRMFKTIKLIPVEVKKTVDTYLNNQVDVIDVTCYPRTNIYEYLFSQNKMKFNFEKTLPINLFFLTITPKAHNKFTSEQIFYALRIISNEYLKFKTFGYGLENSIQFFSSFGNGNLTSLQAKKLHELRNSPKVKFKTPIELGIFEPGFKKVKDALKDFPEIKVISYKSDPAFLPLDQRPDVFVQTTDSSFYEDFSLVSYNFSMDHFGKSKTDSNNWLIEYINTQSKVDRIKKLQDLQFNFLKKPFIYPIGSSPYWAISKPNLVLNFPKFFPGSHWWKIRLINEE